ncbi:MAG: SRPBCC domain-containing protein [Gemmatimonadetes bacterium]|nr:SRPBCC domain-containing protein [Gemmatimonadota bacterium]
MNQQTTNHPATTRGRSVERQIEIDAPIEAVWKALTDAEELTRWFPLNARVTPGPGGSIWKQWESEAAGGEDERIEIWKPGQHLRTAGSEGEWAGIATDYYLQGKGGGTVLRVVSSGFGEGDQWDEILGAWGRGWDFELRGLRHYLENHHGQRRDVAWAVAPYTCGHEAAWTHLTKPGGWFGAGGLTGLDADSSYSVETASGDPLSGVVQVWDPPMQFAGRVEGWNDGMFRAELYSGRVMLWLSTYGVPEADVQALQGRWRESVKDLFAGMS